MLLSIDHEYQGWTAKRIARHALYWGFWLFLYPTVNVLYHDGDFMQWFFYELIVIPAKMLFAYFVVYYLMPKYLSKQQYFHFFSLTLIAAIISGVISRGLDTYIVYPYVFGQEASSPFSSFKIVFKILDQIYTASLVVIIKFIQMQLRENRLKTQLIQEKKDAELKLMRNQLQPHFLFNTLNNLYGLVLTKDERAKEVILKLSEMLSYMLYECEGKLVPLEKELKMLDHYITLEQIRYGKKLDFQFEKSGNPDGKVIAPLLLFPFMENAFKHGPGKVEDGAYIHAKIDIQDEWLHFSIINNKTDTNAEENIKSGIGLKNVKNRLMLLYPEKHLLQIDEMENQFEIQLQLILI